MLNCCVVLMFIPLLIGLNPIGKLRVVKFLFLWRRAVRAFDLWSTVSVIERRGVFRALRQGFRVRSLFPRWGTRAERAGGSAARVSGHPDRAPKPPQSGVPAPLGACLFVFKKRGDLPPLFSLKPLKTLKPFLGPFCPTAPRASGRVGGSKDEYGWVKRRIWVGQKTNMGG